MQHGDLLPLSDHSTQAHLYDSQPVVIDSGSHCIRIGFAGYRQPVVTFPSILGRPKGPKFPPGWGCRSACFGDDVYRWSEHVDLFPAIAHGRVIDWSSMEQIWHQAFYNQLRVAPEEHPFMLVEPCLATNEDREKILESMFETFCVPALNLASPAVLSLGACGRSTGIALHCGNDVSMSVPVLNGEPISDAIRYTQGLGGDPLREFFVDQLNEVSDPPWFVTMKDRHDAETIRRHVSYVASDFDMELAKNGFKLDSSFRDVLRDDSHASYIHLLPSDLISELITYHQRNRKMDYPLPSSNQISRPPLHLVLKGMGYVPTNHISDVPSVSYKLPDGASLNIRHEGFVASEALFRPHLLGLDQLGIHELIRESLHQCDQGVSNQLLDSVVIAGGAAELPGFKERLQRELASTMPRSRFNFASIEASPGLLPWIGGAIHASSTREIWMSQRAYNEEGSRILPTRARIDTQEVAQHVEKWLAHVTMRTHERRLSS